jgi:hypothetical protein
MHQAALELNQQMFPVFLVLLLTAAIAWLFLSNRLYKLLRRSFPELYKALGSPSLFLIKSGASNIKVVRFIFRRDHENSKSPAVIRLCQGLRYIFIIYMICLGGCILLLLDKMLQG